MWQLALRALPMIARVAGGTGAAAGGAEAAAGSSRLMNFAQGVGKVAQAMPQKSNSPQQQAANNQSKNFHETSPYSY